MEETRLWEEIAKYITENLSEDEKHMVHEKWCDKGIDSKIRDASTLLGRSKQQVEANFRKVEEKIMRM